MTPPALTIDEVRRRVDRLPRVRLAHLPTPLDDAPRFSAHLGGPRVFVKRDDCTGLLFGGNKTRHIEFLLAEALEQNCDCLVWGAGVQSNNCRQTAAACARLGLECNLFLSRGSHGDEVQGNLLLDHLVGANVTLVNEQIGPELDALLHAKAAEFRAAGRRPYVWDRGRVRAVAAVSYLLCLAEVVEQLAAQRLKPTRIYSASTGSTGAGLALGKAVFGLDCGLRLVCPILWPWDAREDAATVANAAAALLDLPHRLTATDLDLTLDYIGAGYGKVTPDGRAAIDLLGRTEGLLLDPVYTGKAMACLIDEVRRGVVGRDGVVVFVHTGGLPAVFAYRDELMEGRVG
jgi:L-cysteate sulfo-lyase